MSHQLPYHHVLTNTRKIAIGIFLIVVALAFFGTTFIYRAEGLRNPPAFPYLAGVIFLISAIYCLASARLIFDVTDEGVTFKKRFSRSTKVQPILWSDIVSFDDLYISGVAGGSPGGQTQGMYYTQIIVNQPQKYFPNKATNSQTASVLTFWHAKGKEEDAFTDFLRATLAEKRG